MKYSVKRNGNRLELYRDGERVYTVDLDFYPDIRKWVKGRSWNSMGMRFAGLFPNYHPCIGELSFDSSEGERVWRESIRIISDYLREQKRNGVIRPVPEENRKLWKRIVELSKHFDCDRERPVKVGDLPKLCFRSRDLGLCITCVNLHSPKGELERLVKAMEELSELNLDPRERTERLWNRVIPEKQRREIELSLLNQAMKKAFWEEK